MTPSAKAPRAAKRAKVDPGQAGAAMARVIRAKGAKTAKTTRPVGRPTKYEPRFCDEVEAFMGQGFSLMAFAGSIGVSRSTLNEWMEANGEFSEAVNRAKAKRLLDWERAAHRVRDKGGGPGTATVIVFGLKNMGGDEWKDKQEHDHNVGLTVNINGADADL